MARNVREHRAIIPSGFGPVGCLFLLCFPGTGGCIIGCDIFASLLLRGTLVDADALTNISGATLDVRLLSDDESATESLELFGQTRPDLRRPSAEDGTFARLFSTGLMPCVRPAVNAIPRPEQVEVTVRRDGCEQRFLIEINEDTAFIDLEFPAGVIELKDPILVPSCEQ